MKIVCPFCIINSHLGSIIFRVVTIKIYFIINSDSQKPAFVHPIVKRSLFISIRVAVDDSFSLAEMNKRAFVEHLWSPVDSIHRTVSLSRLHLLTTKMTSIVNES